MTLLPIRISLLNAIMSYFNPQSHVPPSVLATDLDGTLIPLPQAEANQQSLRQLEQLLTAAKRTLVFATGRHFISVMDAMTQYGLPTPEWIVCDVGGAIYQCVNGDFLPFRPYETHLSEVVANADHSQIDVLLAGVKGLELQASDHQQAFKKSYRCASDQLDVQTDQIDKILKEANIPYDCMGSLDPFQDCGLLDVLPRGVSKAYALIWLSTHADFTPDEVVYSGDSGNDYAALISGFRAVVVANHSPGLDSKVTNALEKRGQTNRLYLSKERATCGVLEGCRHFGLVE